MQLMIYTSETMKTTKTVSGSPQGRTKGVSPTLVKNCKEVIADWLKHRPNPEFDIQEVMKALKPQYRKPVIKIALGKLSMDAVLWRTGETSYRRIEQDAA